MGNIGGVMLRRVCIVASLILFGWSFYILALPKKKAIEVMLSNPVVNLGEVRLRKKVPFQFDLKNIGTEDIVFIGAYPDCGCTVIKVEERLLNPNNHCEVGGHIETNQKGAFHHLVQIVFTDSTRQHTYSISGAIEGKDF